MSILSKLLDPIFSSDTRGSDQAAEDALKRSTDAYKGIQAPDLQPFDVIPYQSVGKLSDLAPVSYNLGDMASAESSLAGPSAFDGISIDPRLEGAQMSALSGLQDISKGGLTAQDKADLARIQSEVGQADRGRREAILQNLGARGMRGSGQELLQQLMSSQAAADRQSQADLDVAGMAQKRALDALVQSGNVAGQLRSQDFGEQAQKASAADAIAKFNAANSQQANMANAGAANQFALNRAQGSMNAMNTNNANQLAVQQGNLANAQDIVNKNAALRNDQAQYKANLPQQNLQNKLAVAGGKSGAALPAVNFYQGLGDRQVKKDAAYLDALIKGGSAVAAS